MYIIATAQVRGVRHFFSDDAKCRKLATVAGMEAHALSTHALNLFTEAEIKEAESASKSTRKLARLNQSAPLASHPLPNASACEDCIKRDLFGGRFQDPSRGLSDR